MGRIPYCFTTLTIANVPATIHGSRGEQIDKLFAPWHRLDSPGYAIAVVRDGALVYQRGYGMADFEHDHFSDELRVTYHISLENRKLMVMIGEQPFAIPAEPLLYDEFTARGGVLKFRRNPEKQVRAFTLNIGRICNILFVRAASPGLMTIR